MNRDYCVNRLVNLMLRDKAEKLFFVIECELITQLENPFIDTKLKIYKVNKKSFIDWKNKQNKIIFYD